MEDLIYYYNDSAYVDSKELDQYAKDNNLTDEEAMLDLYNELVGYSYIETEPGNGRSGGRRIIFHKHITIPEEDRLISLIATLTDVNKPFITGKVCDYFKNEMEENSTFITVFCKNKAKAIEVLDTYFNIYIDEFRYYNYL